MITDNLPFVSARYRIHANGTSTSNPVVSVKCCRFIDANRDHFTSHSQAFLLSDSAGFFIAPDLIPVWLRWLQYVMPLTFAVKIGLANEFSRDCGSDLSNILCQSVLNNTDVDPDDVWWYWLALAGIFGVLRLFALIVLRRKALK